MSPYTNKNELNTYVYKGEMYDSKCMIMERKLNYSFWVLIQKKWIVQFEYIYKEN